MTEQKKDLDHNPEETDNLAKSVKPNADFMKSEGICRRCHGKARACGRDDCPQRG